LKKGKNCYNIVEETSAMDDQNSSRHREHTYVECKECVHDMDTRGNVFSKYKGVKSQRKTMQSWKMRECISKKINKSKMKLTLSSKVKA
jgi:hypothetical protein